MFSYGWVREIKLGDENLPLEKIPFFDVGFFLPVGSSGREGGAVTVCGEKRRSLAKDCEVKMVVLRQREARSSPVPVTGRSHPRAKKCKIYQYSNIHIL